uniref:Transcriptional adapter 2-alpha n=1 Tax=Globodera rostochiensis TaxID=31243 RepID=A0A914GXB0_GLORO
MQSTESKLQGSSIPKISQVKIPLEPITLSTWYEMKREQTLPALSEADQKACAFCLEDFEPLSTYAKCLDCRQAEVLICIECLRLGVESPPHKRGHRHVFVDNIGPNFFDNDLYAWGAQEDIHLLNALIRAHLDQWSDLSQDLGKTKSLMDALERLDRCFLRNEIGQCVLANKKRGVVYTWEDPNVTDDRLNELNCNGCRNVVELKQEEISSTEDVVASSNELCLLAPVRKRKAAFFDEEDESDSDSAISKPTCSSSDAVGIGERRMSARSVGESSNSTESRRASRKEHLLAVAKNVAAAEAFRGQRKTSLELSEAINSESSGKCDRVSCDNGGGGGGGGGDQLLCGDEKLAELYASASCSPYFYNAKVPLTNPQTVAKFDEEDLQLLTYMPFRDEFENEYKNDAEQLVSRIVFPREGADLGEVDRFLDEVIYARFNRYNRLMRIRATKKAIIREHNLINEYLNIVKTNICEKGKYAIFEGRFFTSKAAENSFRALFAQLRQIGDKETINQLAKNFGEMENLVEQIDELKELQREGVSKLRGRLKVDSTPFQWSKRRKLKKSDNIEQKKAGLRWKRIKRWTKRNHCQQSGEGDEDE